MVQDDPHPVANRIGHGNGAGYERQGGRKEGDTIASTHLQESGNKYERQGESPLTLPQGRQEPLARANGYGSVVQEPPPSQRQENQSQSFMPKPNSNQAQGGLGGPTFHHGPSPTQASTEGARNQPHPTSVTTKPHGHAFPNENESRRKPYDDRPTSHGDSAHNQPPVAQVRRATEDGHEFEHHDWKSGANRVPKAVPYDALQLDHFNGEKEPNKSYAGNGKPSASPTTDVVQDKPRIQVNVNVYYDQDGNCKVDSTPQQPPPPRRAPSSAPAPAPSRHSPVRPPPPKPRSSGCCSIL